jgi:prephenate dehydrogenase
VKRVGIIGTGLIGASVGLCARRNGSAVYGHDANPTATRRALELGAIEEIVDFGEIFERCDTIVLATPIGATCSAFDRIRSLAPAWELMIDVASVKMSVQTAAAGLCNFVGTHPLAGSEGSGPDGARAQMFEGRSWVIVPSGVPECDERAQTFIGSLGARPLMMSAREHDAAVAVTSHLPQLLAFLLAPKILASAAEAERLCGPAGLETLRLGRSDRRLWDEIFSANADEVASNGRTLAAALVDACDALKSRPFLER